MKTDDLIRTLAADNDWRARPVGAMLAGTLLAAFLVSTMGFAWMLGPRADWRQALGNPYFDLKFIIALGLASAAAVLCVRLARPGAALRTQSLLLALPLLLLAGGIAVDLMTAQAAGPSWWTRMTGTNARVGLTASPLLALPLLAAGLLALRHGAVSAPARAGAAIGLLAGGLAAALYAAHCTDDSPLFVATWYTLAIALVSALGAVLGARLLRY
jgi:hypothetical protein